MSDTHGACLFAGVACGFLGLFIGWYTAPCPPCEETVETQPSEEDWRTTFPTIITGPKFPVEWEAGERVTALKVNLQNSLYWQKMLEIEEACTNQNTTP